MSKLIRNWSYLLFSDLSQAGINFFVFIILARKLSPDGFGELNVVLSVFMLFTVFANNVGSNHVITREVTLHPEAAKGILVKLAPLRVLSFIATTIAVVIYTFHTKNGDLSIIVFSSILVFGNSIWDLSESIAFGRLVTKFTTIFNLIFSISWLSFIIILPVKIISIKLVLVIYCTLFVLKSLAYLYTVTKNYATGLSCVSDIGIKSIFVMSLPYLFMRGLGSLTDQFPILMLNGNCGNAEVGYFSVGSRLIIPITLTVSTALRAVFPYLTKLYEKDRPLFEQKVLQSFGFVFIWGSIMAAILVNTSNLWIPIFFGTKYVNSVETFNILAWFGVGMCFDLLLSTILSSTYKQNILAIITCIDFIIIFPFLYFGAKHGALGLAFAKLASLFLVLAYHIIVVRKVLKINIYNLTFFLSVLFFLVFVIISSINLLFWIKVILMFGIIGVYSVIKQSPLRQSILYVRAILDR